MQVRKSQYFTMLQLFSIIDGRLTTKIEDVYEILNHVLGEDLMTHHLLVAMNFIRLKSPEWYKDLNILFEKIKSDCGNDFQTCVDEINKENLFLIIPQMSKEEKEGFEQYMIENSLLLRRK